MSLDRKALQRELDLAADELDKTGFTDLADRVDQYSELLVTAKAEQVPQIHRGLSRIQMEYEQRVKKVAKEAEPKGDAAKARHAVLSARRASIRRKIAVKRFLRQKAAQKKKANKKVDALTETKKDAKLEESPLKSRLNQRISEAEKSLTEAQHRVARLHRIQEQMK